jgi:membrane glycosyltransferase
VRDRRWCQGNLQHSAVLLAHGLHWVSRLHLARGILAYLTAPLWLAFLAVGGLVWAQQRGAGRPEDAALAGGLFAVTMAMLLIPKLLGVVLVLRERGPRAAAGGGLRLCLSAAAEIVLSALMSPIFMLMQSRAVVDVLRGRDSGWSTQQRDDGRLPLKTAWRRHWTHTLAGVALAAGALALDPTLLIWSAPIITGLVLSIPVSMLTSRKDLGAASRRLGLFLTPEETFPPPVVERAGDLRAHYAAEAPLRAEIDRLMRGPAPMYAPATVRVRKRRYA